MRVLLVNKYLYPKGGSEEYVFQLAKLLTAAGVDVAYWGMKDEKNIVPDEYNCFADNVDFATLGGGAKLAASLNTIYSAENRRRIRKVLDAFKPDIVHIHNYNFQLTPAILPEIKAAGAKIIHTAHDSQLVCPYHRFYNYQQKQVCAKCLTGKYYECVANRCFDGSLLKSALGALESYFYHSLNYYNRFLDAVVSPSEFLARYLRQGLRKPVRVIPNFTDRKEREGRPPGLQYVLYFGRISREKGILDLQHLACWEEYPLVIAGDGPDKGLLQDLGHVNYVGMKRGGELLSLIANAKYVIQPSQWYENCPMTVIESFMCGTPVIAANQGGFIELINHGQDGFLVDFTSEDLNKELGAILARDTSALRDNCRLKYENNYSPDVHIKRIMALYEEVLCRHTSSSKS